MHRGRAFHVSVISLSLLTLPAFAAPLRTVQAIATGPSHACATLTNGQALCWGENTGFALGDGRCWKDSSVCPLNSGLIEHTRATPALVRTLKNVSRIANGVHHSCAIENGGIRCWGGASGNYNVIGDGSPPNNNGQINPIPTITSDLNSSIVMVSSNYEHTCAIRRVSNVDSAWCWGYNASGQLGYGATDPLWHDPMPVSSLPSPIAGIATGTDFTCAAANGAAWCWGNNTVGQLGIGTYFGSHFIPEPVMGLASGVSAIAAAKDHACAIVSGNVMCWGKNNPSGVLGNGTTIDSTTPVAVIGLPANVTAIAMGISHSCALANGGVKCWGGNISGQLGNGSVGFSKFPIDVVGLTTGVIAIAAPGNGNYTCAVLQDHTARCWGDNALGQLGNGNDHGGTSSVPTEVVEADFIFYDSF